MWTELTFTLLLCVLTAAEKPATKRFTALTPPISLIQGEVSNTFHRFAIPKGPIAVYRFEAEVVEKDGDGNVVPVATYDAYLHHHVFGSTHKQYDDMKSRWAPMKPKNFSRSVAFGAGTECRGTPQEFYFPYAFMTVDGEDEWLANVHVINTRNMPSERAHRCLECPCTSEDEFTATSVNGIPFRNGSCNAQLLYEENTVCSATTYHGGLRCCENAEFCLEHKELEVAEGSKAVYYLRYSLEYADIVSENRPLYLAACCDASGSLEFTGNVEYDVPLCDPDTHPGCVHTLSTRQRLDHTPLTRQLVDDDNDSLYAYRQHAGSARDVELVYAVGHQHRGGLGIQLYDDATGDLICASVPKYGSGSEAGNEDGYIVSMSSCTFNPPRRMSTTDIVRIVALYNNTVPHTGVMSLMYIALSDFPLNETALDSTMSTSTTLSHQSLASTSEMLVAGAVAGTAVCALVMVVVTRWKKRSGYTPLAPQST
ncbi:Stress up-regulated Nod 19 [Plasmopara halstedii]|uniref:Stress up-regulated Nod 19 n=1 Tax=Plasmopara halstedii TaxID=4781 RepID=A0A0P1AEK5_PLAHL|nr:Stress up-regulated Nod 19 [Plasmopara halstedii]CEG38887.1 Stress up-regulated Nod 19 [Plasmopara halstedii]|eukprot:XP_024575256.1 Stress up-regulated Nod 19 [Plasmopara halstedii]